MSRMERILIILVGVGLVFNALTFLIVTDYFRHRDPAQAAAAADTRSSAKDTVAAAETQRLLKGLETNLNQLSKKVDTLSSRTAVQSSFSTAGRTPRGGRSGPGGRRPVAAETAQGEEPEAEHEAEAPALVDPRKSLTPATTAPGTALEAPKAAPAGTHDAAGAPAPAGANGETPAPPATGENGEAPAGSTPPPAAGAPAGTEGAAGAEGAAGTGGGD